MGSTRWRPTARTRHNPRVPDPPHTLAALRPTADADELPVHRRTIDLQVYEREAHHVVIGTLHDQRPWASGELGPRDLHRMELGIVVRRADLVIVDAAATMGTFPHAECPTIEDAFGELVGLSACRSPGATPMQFRPVSGASVAAVTWNSWPAPWGLW